MKKLLILSVIGVLSLSSFSTIEKKEVVKSQTYVIYCNGVRTGFITCDCTSAQIQSMANTMCNP